jgi:hypothetical protein
LEGVNGFVPHDDTRNFGWYERRALSNEEERIFFLRLLRCEIIHPIPIKGIGIGVVLFKPYI